MNYVDVRGIKLRFAIYHSCSYCYAPRRGSNIFGGMAALTAGRARC